MYAEGNRTSNPSTLQEFSTAESASPVEGKPSHTGTPKQGMLSLQKYRSSGIQLPFCQLRVPEVSQEGAIGMSVSLEFVLRKAEDIRCRRKGTSVDFSGG